jgi:diacylglycerol kinase family enzyme
MRVTLIHNPNAGVDEFPSTSDLLAIIRAAGHAVTCYPPDDDTLDRTLEDPGDLVAVAGGDGTVGTVAGRLIGRRIPIAVLPLGTANNIARTLGIADTPFDRLIAGWARARRIGFDAGVASGPWGTTRFIEGLGIGVLARAMSRLKPRAGAVPGKADDREAKTADRLKRLSEWLRNSPAKALKITLDGLELSGEYILLEAMNIQHIGTGLHLAPAADPGDSFLDVVLFTAEDRGELDDYLAGRSSAGNLEPLSREFRRGQILQIQWDGSDLHIDDKVWPSPVDADRDARFVLDVSVDHHALEFLV